MEGIRYLTDDQNRRVAVQIDLTRFGDIWEDIYDALVAASRSNEPTHDWQQVRDELLGSASTQASS
jgi:hypothetical protein